ncbi:hypothetical protein [Phaeocystidibacter luteus]|uniref:Uncharacterized protein n=1 Tax=Phaeocystidibacter luteus TaxID=911197 RepID=A0A6N6RKX4_9FLAO|nr:hypothetical protein [Phaeocystidibacter luteus]KAB2809978.1 hypothetical protein F8C67_08850 [Phaeocystidibacter luteus]
MRTFYHKHIIILFFGFLSFNSFSQYLTGEYGNVQLNMEAPYYRILNQDAITLAKMISHGCDSLGISDNILLNFETYNWTIDKGHRIYFSKTEPLVYRLSRDNDSLEYRQIECSDSIDISKVDITLHLAGSNIDVQECLKKCLTILYYQSEFDEDDFYNIYSSDILYKAVHSPNLFHFYQKESFSEVRETIEKITSSKYWYYYNEGDPVAYYRQDNRFHFISTIDSSIIYSTTDVYSVDFVNTDIPHVYYLFVFHTPFEFSWVAFQRDEKPGSNWLESPVPTARIFSTGDGQFNNMYESELRASCGWQVEWVGHHIFKFQHCNPVLMYGPMCLYDIKENSLIYNSGPFR